jgi:hypothetical protein
MAGTAAADAGPMPPMLLPAATPAAWRDVHLAALFHGPGLASDEGGRWWTRSQLLADDAAALRAQRDRLCADHGTNPRAAVTYLAGWLGGTLAGAVGYALAGSGAGMLVDGDRVRWHQHPDGWIDGVNLGRPVTLVEPDHPWAALPDVEATGRAELRARTATALAAAVRPIVHACHGLARVGLIGLWHEVADGLAMSVAYQHTLPADPAVPNALLATLAAPGTPWRARARLEVAAGPRGWTYVGQKGGCCLAFTCPSPAETEVEADPPDGYTAAYRDRFGAGRDVPDYCSTCSLRDFDDCRQRQLFWLEHHPPPA